MNDTIYINGSDHIAGRLASKIAKTLLEGKQVVVFFSENIRYAFPIERARKIYESYLHKRCVVNPRKGPYHYVEPSKYFRRMVKRMLKHKTKKGENALKRLTVYESIPREHFNTNLNVCPIAIMKIKANPKRKSVSFGELLKDFGWKHYKAAVENNARYEEYRKIQNEENMRLKEERDAALCDSENIKRVQELMNSIE